MELAVFGATGGTGRRLTTQTLAAGHEIRALTRSPSKLPSGEQLTIVEGDVLDSVTVHKTIRNTDAVVCLLGRTPNNPPDIVSRGTKHILQAMTDSDVERLVVLTSMGLGSSASDMPWFLRVVNATILHRLLADKARQEELVMQSILDWTIVRPGGLTDSPPTGEYVHGVDINAPARPIPRGDVADFLLTVLEDRAYIRETPVVTTDRDIRAGFLWEQTTAITRRLLADS